MQRGPTRLNNIIKGVILNADAALYGTVCRYHTHKLGNICRRGKYCHYLHLSALERPRCVPAGQKCDAPKQDKLSTMAKELRRVSAGLATLQRALLNHGRSTLQALAEQHDPDSDAASDDLALADPQPKDAAQHQVHDGGDDERSSKSTMVSFADTTEDEDDADDADDQHAAPLEQCHPMDVLRRNEQLLRECKHTQLRQFAPFTASRAPPPSAAAHKSASTTKKRTKKRKRSSKKRPQSSDILKCFSRADTPKERTGPAIRKRKYASYSDWKRNWWRPDNPDTEHDTEPVMVD